MSKKELTFFTCLSISYIFTLFFFLFPLHNPKAADCDDIDDKLKKISCLEDKTKQLKQQAATLGSQINFMNAQITLAATKIQETENQIDSTQKEIDLLGSRIEGLDTSLDVISKLLLRRVVEQYKQHTISIFDILLDSSNANDLADRLKYLKSTQQDNQKLLVQVQLTKTNFEAQKKLREEKKIKLDELEKQLTLQKSDLNYQKSQKQLLLQDTQNDETKYQQLLSQALAEFNAIQKAIATGSKIGPVKRGDPIALVGNSGAPYCSTGPHLHFEVRKDGSWVNAENYLTSKNVDNRQDGSNPLGSGNWDWPIQDQVILEQRYGKTPYSWRYTYSGGIHTGVDMWTRSSEVIRAPSDGTLYSSSQNCSGATINVKYIDHGNGLISFYLHVQ